MIEYCMLAIIGLLVCAVSVLVDIRSEFRQINREIEEAKLR